MGVSRTVRAIIRHVDRPKKSLKLHIKTQVYAWGDNDEGQCGNGKTNAVPTPQLIETLQVCACPDFCNDTSVNVKYHCYL